MVSSELARQVETQDEPARRLGRVGPLLENVTESASACMVTMLQGNLFAMTLGHWIIASRTGLLSGVLATTALFLLGTKGRTAVALLLALATFLADYLSHPSNFGGALGEALVTAVGAGLLSVVVGKVVARWRSRARAAEGVASKQVGAP